jgi:hypothetical protein
MPNLIGSNPEQISTNGMLGTLAFQSHDSAVITGGLITPTVAGSQSEVSLGTYPTALTVVWSQGNRQTATLSGNTAISMDFVRAPVGVYQLKLIQDATGGRVPTWSTNTPGTTRWLGSTTAPSVNTAANGVTFVTVYWDGVLAFGTLARVGVL